MFVIGSEQFHACQSRSKAHHLWNPSLLYLGLNHESRHTGSVYTPYQHSFHEKINDLCSFYVMVLTVVAFPCA